MALYKRIQPLFSCINFIFAERHPLDLAEYLLLYQVILEADDYPVLYCYSLETAGSLPGNRQGDG